MNLSCLNPSNHASTARWNCVWLGVDCLRLDSWLTSCVLDVVLDGGILKLAELLRQSDLIQCAEKKPQSLKAGRRIKGRPFVRLQIADKRVHRWTGANRNPIRLSIREPDRLASERHDVPDFGELLRR